MDAGLGIAVTHEVVFNADMLTVPEQRYTFDRVVRMVLSGAALVAVFLLLRYLSDVLIPFAIAVVLAYLLNPLVTIFEQRTGRRWLGVVVGMGTLLVGLLIAIALLIPLTVSQVSRFREDIEKLQMDIGSTAVPVPIAPTIPVEVPPKSVTDGLSLSSADSGEATAEVEKSTLGWTELMDAWERYRKDAEAVPPIPRAERIREFRRSLDGTIVGNVLQATISYVQSEEFQKLVVEAVKTVAIGGWSVVTFTMSVIIGITGFVLVIVYLIFLLLDFPTYAQQWRQFLPPNYRGTIVEFWEQFQEAMRQYFRGQSVVAILTGSMYVVGFTIIGLPMAVPLGIIIGFFNMVPYLAAVTIVPAMFFAFLRAIEQDTGFLSSIVWTLSVYGVVQTLQDTVITPRVMGEATGLRPVAILLGVFIWGKLLGFLGILLAIPLTCLGIAYYRRYVLRQTREPAAAVGPMAVLSPPRPPPAGTT